MYPIKRSIGRGFAGTPGGLFDILTQLQNIGAGNQGTVYFVESNAGSDGYDGLSWDKAFKTLTYALAISDANISRGSKGWASRNTVFCRGTFDEDLVLLADKTDIIGIGEGITKARLIGTHIPADNTYTTRLINWEFRDDSAGVLWTFDSGSFEFHNCTFSAYYAGGGATPATTGLVIDNATGVTISNCKFKPLLTSPFSTAAISLTMSGAIQSCRIVGNEISGATGIDITVDGTHTYCDCRIQNNFIHATGECIDDASDDWYVIDNRMISDGVVASAIDANAALGAGNIVTGSDSTRTWPFAVTS